MDGSCCDTICGTSRYLPGERKNTKSNVLKTMWKEDVIQFEVPVGICMEKGRLQKVTFKTMWKEALMIKFEAPYLPG